MTIEERADNFRIACNCFRLEFKHEMITEFFEYWSEPNKSGTKMKWELEKTWDLRRRLKRWANNGFGKTEKTEIIKPKIKVEPMNDFERIDELLNRYLASPTSVPFEEFGKWYELMREHKLLKTFTKEEVMSLQTVYNGDNKKCRCAAVQKTFDAYANSGLRVMDIIKMRSKLNKTV